MDPGLCFKKLWFDDDVIELEIHSCDGNSLFANKVCCGYQDMDGLIAGLDNFKDQVYGGIYDIELGSFGPEYAGGAFHVRLLQDRGKIHITINAQSEFEEFGTKKVASEATLYLISEPALLDNLIAELKSLKAGLKDEAKLEAA